MNYDEQPNLFDDLQAKETNRPTLLNLLPDCTIVCLNIQSIMLTNNL